VPRGRVAGFTRRTVGARPQPAFNMPATGRELPDAFGASYGGTVGTMTGGRFFPGRRNHRISSRQLRS